MKNNLAKNTIMLTFCALINKGLLFIMIPLFSRWLTVSEYGSYDVYATYITLLIPIITFSCSEAIFRLSIDKTDYNSKKYYITNGLSIITINLFITSIFIYLFGKVTDWDVTIPFLILLIGETFDNYFQGYLRAIKKLNIYAITKSIGVVGTSIMVTVLVKFLNMGLNGIMYGYAFGCFFSIFFSIIYTKWWKFLDIHKIKFKIAKELISYSYALIPNSISWWIINVSDRSIINIYLGNEANGIYGITYKIPNLCSSLFAMFSISWQETASELAKAKEKNEYYIYIYNRLLRILLTLCIGIMSCNFIFFEYIFDKKYYEGHLYSAILITSIIFSSISQFFGGIQISLKKPKSNGISTIIGAIANVVIHIVLVENIGLFAAAISTLVSNIIVCIIRKLQLKKDMYIKINKNNYIYIFVFIYFSIISTISCSILFNSINLIIAIIIFLIGNKEYCYKIFKKFKSMKNKFVYSK